MFTINDLQAAFIQLMHRAGRGEKVGPDLDDLTVRLEQTKIAQSASEWRQGVADIRGFLMTHFGSSLTGRNVVVQVTDHAQMRGVFFVEIVIIRLGQLTAKTV